MDKILIVVPESILIENLKIILELEGFEVMSCTNGEDALNIFSRNINSIDSIIFDDNLPGFSSAKLVELFKNICIDISIIILTDNNDIETNLDALRAGAFEIFKKPIWVKELLPVIKGSVANTKHLRENKELQDKLLKQNIYLQNLQNSAEKILLKLVPKYLPDIPSFKFSVEYEPCDAVGGDMYSIEEIGNYICFYLFDVTSHGILAAVISIMIKSFLKNLNIYAKNLTPKTFSKIIHDLNNEISLNTYDNVFATLFIGFIDKTTKKLFYISAGHINQYIITKTSLIPLTSTGIILGAFENTDYEYTECELNSGDKLFLYTDGLIESSNSSNQIFSTSQLEKFLIEKRTLSVDNLIPYIYNKSKDYCNEKFDDDVTAIGIELL